MTSLVEVVIWLAASSRDAIAALSASRWVSMRVAQAVAEAASMRASERLSRRWDT